MKDVLIFFGFVFIGVIIVMLPISAIYAFDEIKDYINKKSEKKQPELIIDKVNSSDLMPESTPLLNLLK